MFTGFRDRLTYFGTLDDAVERYPWPTEIDLPTMRQQLITSAIYDKKILVTDGYVVANATLLNDLKNIGTSLMGNMLTSEVARFFLRDEAFNLAEGIERNAATIATHREVVNDKNWPSMREDLELASKRVEHLTLRWPKGKNMGHMFYLLLERVRGMNQQDKQGIVGSTRTRDFDRVFDEFQRRINRTNYDAARTTWEDCCWWAIGGLPQTPKLSILYDKNERARLRRYDDIRVFMNVANELHHLAYSVGADASLREESTGVSKKSTIGVATSVITAFPDLIGPEEVACVSEHKGLQYLNQLLITVPPELKFKEDFSFITQFTSLGSCRHAREHYLQSIEEFLNGSVEFDSPAFRTSIAARDEFVNELAQIMFPHVEKNALFNGVEFAISGLAYLLKTCLVGAADRLLGAASSFIGCFPLEIGVDHFKTKLVERLLVSFVEASLTREGIAATYTDNTLRVARNYGFYLGPLKEEGCLELANKVGPHPSRLR